MLKRSGSDDGVVLEQRSLRVIRGLTESDAALVFDCWAQLMAGHRQLAAATQTA